MTTIISWNVNGIRSVSQKGFFEWLKAASPSALCVQETKADPSQLGKEFFEATDAEGRPYETFWASAKRRGYSGVAIYTRVKPVDVRVLGVAEYDDEGRYLEADLGPYVLVSAYFPNSQDAGARIDYKIGFCESVMTRLDALVAAGRHVVLCGDYNIAHTPIDLTYPKANEGNPGYLPEERAWMDRFLSSGYVDAFRRLHPDQPGLYTWWSYRMRAREKDIGWRIDYTCVNEACWPLVKNAAIHKDVMGSDHCPVSLDLDLAAN
ncbi:MAG: exodeoxyribonuclease III [Spirochaetales bacterium]|nr:exodeoxyribonuclease III [Spirochaetales bacterium]MBP7264518.1 exodeoxyribonuclease III [Spirochaetia bacterium]